MLSDTDRKEVVKLKIERAWQSLEEAKAVAKLGFWNLSGNRLYYSAYYICSALLVSHGYAAHTHAGVIHLIGQKYVATGLLEKEYGRLLARLFELRQSGDYNDRFNADQEIVTPYFTKVEQLITAITELIRQ